MKSFNLLIVGSGGWPTKVKSIIEKKADVKVRQIEARKLGQIEIDNLNNNSIIWIATTPSNQLKILDSINFSNHKLIVEKPTYSSRQDIFQFKKAIQKNYKIWISQPWTYSQIWREFKNDTSQADFEYVKIQRGSNSIRNYIPPWLDWSFHDLLLIFDLLEPFEIENFESTLEVGNGNLRGDILIGHSQFNMDVGYFNSKIGQWDAEQFSLDFVRNRATVYGVDTYYSEDDPILNMLTSISDEEINLRASKQFAYLEKLFLKLI